jgi:hypothetical protein
MGNWQNVPQKLNKDMLVKVRSSFKTKKKKWGPYLFQNVNICVFYYRLFLSGVDKLRALKEIEDAAKTMEESEGAKNLT